MKKNVDLAKRIAKNLNKDWHSDLFDINVHDIFKPIYDNTAYSTTIANTITAYIVFAYDSDSSWLNYKQDRYENKEKILLSLGASTKIATYAAIANNSIAAINDVIAVYLQSQVTSKWKQAISYLDFADETLRMASQKTEEEKVLEKMNKDGVKISMRSDIDIEKILKAQVIKSDLLDKAHAATDKAHRIIEEIGKEFLELNQAVEVDLGFSPASEKSIHYELWRDWTRNVSAIFRAKERAERLKAAK